MSYEQTCKSDTDCYYLYHCTEKNICEHNEVWPPNSMQIIVTIILPFLIGIINVGGLGGGVVKVPIMMILLNYQQKVAAQIGYCITFGSGFPNAILLLLQKHPYLNRPLIDFNTVTVLNTTVLLGSVIGSLANQICPDLYLMLLFICFLIVTTPYLWNRARNLWKEEKKYSSDSLLENSKKIQLLPTNEKNQDKSIDSNNENDDDEDKQEKEEIINRQLSLLVQANFLESSKDNAIVNLKNARSSKNSSQIRSISRLSGLRLGLSGLRNMNNYRKSNEKIINTCDNLIESQEVLKETQKDNIIKHISENDLSHNISINFDEEENQQQLQQQNNSVNQKENNQQIQSVQQIISTQQLNSEIKQILQNEKNTFGYEAELIKVIQDESKIIPLKKMLIMVSQLVLVILLNLLRGEGSSSIIGVKKCSVLFWILTVMIAVVSIIIGIIVVKMLKNEQDYKISIGYEFDEKDLRYNRKTFFYLFGIGLVGGFLTGSVNAGASMAVLPVLLIMGMHPRVASATSGFNTAFMALTLITTVILSGELSILDIITFTLIALIGGFIVSKVIYFLVNKYKKQSIVLFSVFIIGIIINISNILYIIRSSIDYGWESLTGAPIFCN